MSLEDVPADFATFLGINETTAQLLLSLVVIFVLIGVALGPTVISSVTNINATTLGSMPLATVIILLATYLPSFYYIALVLGGMVGIWAAVKYTS